MVKFKEYMNQKEVNLGRQNEFDYLKALFLFAIFFIHSFQLCGIDAGKDSAFYKVIYIICTMSGAPIYLFVMGMGSTYSKKGAGATAKAGVRWILLQFVNNLGYIAGIMLSLALMGIIGRANVEEGVSLSLLFLPYLNIFFLAGALYLLLALLKRCHTPIWLYPVLAIGAALISPLIAQQKTGIAIVDIMLSPLLGGEFYTSFCVLPYVVYALLGVFFGEVLKRTQDKKRLYLRLMAAGALVVVAFAIYTAFVCDGLDEVYSFIASGYIYPDLFRALANLSVILILSGGFYLLEGRTKKAVRLDAKVKYLSRHVSKYYAIHPCVYLFMSGLFGFAGQSALVCCVLFIICMAICEFMVLLYNKSAKSK